MPGKTPVFSSMLDEIVAVLMSYEPGEAHRRNLEIVRKRTME